MNTYTYTYINPKTYIQREMCGCKTTVLYYIYIYSNFIYLLNIYQYIHICIYKPNNIYIYINPKTYIQRQMYGCKTTILYINTDFLYLLNINTDLMYLVNIYEYIHIYTYIDTKTYIQREMCGC